MKGNKGITLTSLIIYITAMMVVVALISTLTTFFSKNIKMSDINSNTKQYTKFSSIFLDEINAKDNKVISYKTTGEGLNKISYIIFSSRKSIYIYRWKSDNI